jgi:hypothetical protein
MQAEPWTQGSSAALSLPVSARSRALVSRARFHVFRVPLRSMSNCFEKDHKLRFEKGLQFMFVVSQP